MDAAKTLKGWRGAGWRVQDAALVSDGSAPLFAKETPPRFVLETEIQGPRDFRILLARDEQGRMLAFDVERGDDRGRFLLLEEAGGEGAVLREQRLGYSLLGDRSDGRVLVRVVGDAKKFQVDLNGLLFELDLGAEEEVVGAELLGSVGEFGAAPGKLGYPNSVTGDDNGDVYVLDQHNNRVSRFSEEGEFRELIQLQNRSDTDDTRYNQYRGLIVSRDGDLWSIDTQRAEIMRFDSKGRFKSSLGGSGAGDGFMYSAFAVDVDDGDVVVTDSYDRACHRFDEEGNFTSRLSAAEFGENAYIFAAVGDGRGGTFVAEMNRAEIRRFDSENRLTNTFGGRGSGQGRFMRLWDVATDPEGNLYVSDPSDHGLHKLAPDGTFIRRMGAAENLMYPTGVVVDARGNVLVADSRNRVLKYSPQGRHLGAFEFEAGPGEYKQFRLALDDEGRIFLSDDGNSRVWKFSANGEYLTHWGRRGTEPGFLMNPGGLAADGRGNVLVADSGNHRLQIFSDEGELIRSIGSMGSNQLEFRSPRDVALDEAGNIFVLDTSNNRVQKLKPDGTFAAAWNSDSRGPYRYPQHFHVQGDGGYILSHASYGSLDRYDAAGVLKASMGERGAGQGRFQGINGPARAPDGGLFVLGGAGFRVTRFSREGVFLGEFGEQGNGPGQFQYVTAMTVDEIGRVHLLDHQSRMHTFQGSGEFIGSVGLPRVNTGQHGLAVDDEGNIYCTEISQNLIRVFDAAGRSLRQWGGAGDGPGRFMHPRGIQVREDLVYVGDAGNARVQVFDRAGVFKREFGRLGSAPGRFRQITSLHVNGRGEILAADYQDGFIQIMNENGEMLKRVGGKGTDAGRFKYVYGVTGDGDDNFYATDHQNHRIQKFDAQGDVVKTWGSRGGGNGAFQYPRDPSHDGADNLYILDGNNFRVQKFDSQGNFERAFGERGSEPHQFQGINALHASSRGSVYVCDGSKYGIMRFDDQGAYQGFFGGRGVGAGYFYNPSSVTAGPDGSIYVADQSHRRIQRFNAQGEFVLEWGEEGTDEGRFQNLGRIVADGNGIVYVSDYGRDYLMKFDGEGNYLGRLGSFGRAGDLAVDEDDNILIIDHGNARIVIFDPAGNRIAAWGDPASLGYPAAITPDLRGGLFLVDNRAWRLRHFDYQGKEDFNVSGYGSAPGLLNGATDMIFDGENTLLVCDGGGRRIQRFDARGRFLMEWLLPAARKTYTPYPVSVTVDRENHIYVVDSSQAKVWKYRFVSPGFEPTPALGLQSFSDKQSWRWLSLAGDSSVAVRPLPRRVARRVSPPALPELESLWPSKTGPGDEVIVHGRNFSRVSRVEVAGLEQVTRYVGPHELRFRSSGISGPVFVREGEQGPLSPKPLELKIEGRA